MVNRLPVSLNNGIRGWSKASKCVGKALLHAASLLIVAATSSTAQTYTFTTLAGAAGSADGTGSAARFYQPAGVATDSSGNVYVADTFNYTIRKITPVGVVTTLAGMAGISGTTDGTGSGARFFAPAALAADGSGNVYVADYNAIRKITPAGVVTTLAGMATGSCGTTDGTGSAARFCFYNSNFVNTQISGVTTDSGGNVYVSDSYTNGHIRKITPAGVVTTLPGKFYIASGVAIDSGGNVYVAEYGADVVSKITPAGVVSIFAGSYNISGFADGTGSAARFNSPRGVATDSSGNVYVADTNNSAIRKITPAGLVSTFVVFGSSDLTSVETDSSGNLYVADEFNNTISKITPAAMVTTLAGLNISGSADRTGPAAQFSFPYGVATDSSRNVYVADKNNYTIRKITPTGVVSTFAGTAGSSGSADGTGSAARFVSPAGVAIDSSGNVYVADESTIRKITPAGVVSTFAGLAGSYGSMDGTGSAALFRRGISGVATDSSGNVYVADTGNYTIRKITPVGVVSTFAGTVLSSGSMDGTGAAAQFNQPSGVATDSSGNVYVADTGNYTIRKITPAAVVTTLAGIAQASGYADGTGSAAQFFYPYGVATDSSGNVYVADSSNNAIRKITPAGVVTTIAGGSGGQGFKGANPTAYGFANGTGAAASFRHPSGVATDSSGDVYVADTQNYTIRKGFPGVAPPAIGESFGAVSIPMNGTTSLSFTVSNPNMSTILTGIGFNDTLPAGLLVSTPNGQSGSSCGGTIADTQGTSGISLNGATLPGGGSCTFSVNVTGTASGIQINATSAVTSVEGGTGVATSASLTVTIGAPMPGDANGDGQVTVADVFYLINNLFAGGPVPIGSADANGDGQVTIADIFYLINYLFAGGPPPH